MSGMAQKGHVQLPIFFDASLEPSTILIPASITSQISNTINQFSADKWIFHIFFFN